MIKCELHAHVKGTSSCALSAPEILVADYKKAGYGAITITNHYAAQPYEKYFEGNTHTEKINSFLRVFDQTEKLCKLNGIKAFLGVEVRDTNNTEYNILGFDRDFLYNNQPLFNYSQEQLFALCEKYGLFMYQTHPFRKGVIAGNPKFMHGAESFNGHFHHENINILAQKFCEENNLVKLSGSDYHCPNQPITAGVYLPEDIKNEKELVAYLTGGKAQLIEKELEYLSGRKAYLEGEL